MKSTEGYDRILQRILIDGSDPLISPLNDLFNLICTQKKIPEQWKVAKTIPIFKNKGESKNIESYRPLLNLCWDSKVFEKLL